MRVRYLRLPVQRGSLYNSTMSNTEETTAGQQCRCLRCGRILRAATSVAAGYGRGCKARIRAAAIAAAVRDFTAQQVTKALELIADNGLVPTRHAGVFRAVASDGTTTYLTHSDTCNCPAGLRSRNRCYHSAAVRMVLARKAA